MRSGIILAGGQSKRFGEQDKALAELDGKSLVRHVADRMTPVVDELVVNCRAEQVNAFRHALDDAAVDPRFAVDAVPGCGPVAGMATGLQDTTASMALVTACDMPSLDSDFLESLFDDAHSHTGAVPIFNGYRQPLCAVYRVPLMIEACHASHSSDPTRLQAVLDRLDPVLISEDEVRARTTATTFKNVNTQIDLQAIDT